MNTKEGVPSWEVTPITKTFQNMSSKIILQTDVNTPAGKNMSEIQNQMNQSMEDRKYDNIQSMKVKPIQGGMKNKKKNEKKNKYVIEFRNQKYTYDVDDKMNEEDVIKIFMKEKNIKNDHLISILNKKSKEKNMYHLKSTKRHNIRKLYSS